jgi:hypothetical protein
MNGASTKTSINRKIRLRLHQQGEVLGIFLVQNEMKTGRNREEIASNCRSTKSVGSREHGHVENGSAGRCKLGSNALPQFQVINLSGCVASCGCGMPAPSTKF